jgi:hypothetical protein
MVEQGAAFEVFGRPADGHTREMLAAITEN